MILLNQSYNERRVAEYAYIAPVSGIHNLKQAPTNMNFVKVQKPITIGDLPLAELLASVILIPTRIGPCVM